MSEAPTTRGLTRKRRFVAEPGIWEPRGCLPGCPVDMGHAAALMVHCPCSDLADSERAQRATFQKTIFSRFPATLRNKQLELPL
jgi:hypothetical protein